MAKQAHEHFCSRCYGVGPPMAETRRLTKSDVRRIGRFVRDTVECSGCDGYGWIEGYGDCPKCGGLGQRPKRVVQAEYAVASRAVAFNGRTKRWPAKATQRRWMRQELANG